MTTVKLTKQIARKVLQTVDAGLEALVELKSPGAEWLDLCEEEPATK